MFDSCLSEFDAGGVRGKFNGLLIGKGVDLKSVSVLMGHSSVAMTAHYSEDNPHRLRRIVAELA